MPELMSDDSNDSGKKVYCAWCTLPFLSQGDNRKTLENLTYHDVCFDQLEVWWRANSAKQQKKPMEDNGTYTTNSTAPASDRSERMRLLLDCQRLLKVVASRPGAIKLLLGVHFQLELFAGYKASRPKPTERTK